MQIFLTVSLTLLKIIFFSLVVSELGREKKVTSGSSGHIWSIRTVVKGYQIQDRNGSVGDIDKVYIDGLFGSKTIDKVYIDGSFDFKTMDKVYIDGSFSPKTVNKVFKT